MDPTAVLVLVPAAVPTALSAWTIKRFIDSRHRSSVAFEHLADALQRRHDLVATLLVVTRSAPTTDVERAEAVARARINAMGCWRTGSLARAAGAEDALTSAIGSLLASVESDPTLRTSRFLPALRDQISTTEDRIHVSRQWFNDATLVANHLLDRTPHRFVARCLQLRPHALFEARAGTMVERSIGDRGRSGTTDQGPWR